MLQQLTIQPVGQMTFSIGEARPLQKPVEGACDIGATVSQRHSAKLKPTEGKFNSLNFSKLCTINVTVTIVNYFF